MQFEELVYPDGGLNYWITQAGISTRVMSHLKKIIHQNFLRVPLQLSLMSRAWVSPRLLRFFEWSGH